MARRSAGGLAVPPRTTPERARPSRRKPAAGSESLSAELVVRAMADAADAVKATDIVILDIRDLTIIADFFLLCTGKSSIQIRAIADRIDERLRELGLRKLRIEGYQEATWVLIDYGDVVAHVMAAEQRAFYDLEGFWSRAKRISPGGATEPAP